MLPPFFKKENRCVVRTNKTAFISRSPTVGLLQPTPAFTIVTVFVFFLPKVREGYRGSGIYRVYFITARNNTYILNFLIKKMILFRKINIPILIKENTENLNIPTSMAEIGKKLQGYSKGLQVKYRLTGEVFKSFQSK